MQKIFNIVNSTLVEYWKSKNLTEKDFFCRDCGRLIIDLNEASNIKYNKKSKRASFKFLNINNKNNFKYYVESEYSRWCIKGRDLSGKTFFRHLCWDCFFRHLPEIEDIPRRARKSKWYKAILDGHPKIPVSSTSPSAYFKLLFDITDEELQKERSKFDTASIESFIRRYGKDYGRIKYEEYCKRQAYTCSKEYMMNEKGFTEDDWKKYNKLRSSTKENFIIRYGK